MEFDVTLGFQPRPHQMKLLQNMKKFNFIEWHRRSGKTYFARWFMVQSAILNPNSKYLYLFPAKNQAEDNTWQELKDIAGRVKGVHVDNQNLVLTFPNKSTIRLSGAANAEAFRGGGLSGVVLDELRSFPNLKQSWEEIISPALFTGDSKGSFRGWAIFISTPAESKSHYYYRLRELSQKMDRWYYTKLGADVSGVLSEQDLEEQRIILDEESYRREYLCEDSTGSSTSFFGNQIRAAAFAGRIGLVEHNPAYPVLTGWDLGFDGVAIWFAQLINKELRFIDYYEKLDHKDSMQPFINMLLEKPYTYVRHFLPHDGGTVRMTGDKAVSPAEKLKEVFDAECVKVVPRKFKNENILPTRANFFRFWFDDTKCAVGLDSLRNYRPKLNALGEKTGKEVHDKSSHGGTAFMTIVNNIDFENDQYTMRGRNLDLWENDTDGGFQPRYFDE